jgi:hypothetical protein
MKAGTTPRVPSAEATASIPVYTLCDLSSYRTFSPWLFHHHWSR